MLGHPDRDEWRLLKNQFDALEHDEGVLEDSIETILTMKFVAVLANGLRE